MRNQIINEHDADVLSHIVNVCEDGKQFYQHAAQQAHNPALRQVFNEQLKARLLVINALRPEYEMRKAKPLSREQTVEGRLRELYTEVKTALVADDKEDYVLVEQLLASEDRTLIEMQEAINALSNPALSMQLNDQLTHIQQAHARMHHLKSVLKPH